MIMIDNNACIIYSWCYCMPLFTEFLNGILLIYWCRVITYKHNYSIFFLSFFILELMRQLCIKSIRKLSLWFKIFCCFLIDILSGILLIKDSLSFGHSQGSFRITMITLYYISLVLVRHIMPSDLAIKSKYVVQERLAYMIFFFLLRCYVMHHTD